MKKILAVLCFTVSVLNISILMFSQFAMSSPFPGDSAIVAGNTTTTENMSSPQPPIDTNESIITNGSLLSSNNTNQTNQTIGMFTNNT